MAETLNSSLSYLLTTVPFTFFEIYTITYLPRLVNVVFERPLMAFLDHKDVLAVTQNYFSSGSKFQFDGLFRPRGCSCGTLEVDIIRRSFLRPFSRPHFQGRCHGPKKFPLVRESSI